MLQFSCTFAFSSTFRLSNQTQKITRILKLCVRLPFNMAPFSKEDKILIKSLYECKFYNGLQFITEFPIKVDEQQHQQAAGEVEKIRNSVTHNFHHFGGFCPISPNPNSPNHIILAKIFEP